MTYIEKMHGEDLLWMLESHITNYSDKNEAIMELLDNSIDAWVENGFRAYGRKDGEKEGLKIEISIFPGGIQIVDNAGGLDENASKRMIRFAHKHKYRNTVIGGFGLGFKASTRNISGGESVHISWIEPNHDEGTTRKRKIHFTKAFWNQDKNVPGYQGIADKRSYPWERGEMKIEPVCDSEFDDLKGKKKGQAVVSVTLPYSDQNWWGNQTEKTASGTVEFVRYENLKKKIEETYAKLIIKKGDESGLSNPIEFSLKADFEYEKKPMKEETQINKYILEEMIDVAKIPSIVPQYGVRSWMWVERFHPSQHFIRWTKEDLGKSFEGKDLQVTITAGFRSASFEKGGTDWGGIFAYGNSRLFHNGDFMDFLMDKVPTGGTLARALRFKAIIEFNGDCVDIPWNPYKTGFGHKGNQAKILFRIRQVISEIYAGYMFAIEKTTSNIIGKNTHYPRPSNTPFDCFKHHVTNLESVTVEKTNTSQKAGDLLDRKQYGIFDRTDTGTLRTSKNTSTAKKWVEGKKKPPPQQASKELKLKLWKKVYDELELDEKMAKKLFRDALFNIFKQRNHNFRRKFKSSQEMLWKKLSKGEKPPWKK